MKTIGIIGGGQLGLYLARAAYDLGYKTGIYNDIEKCSAKECASYFYCGSFDDKKKLEEFCQKCDLITYEFENINSSLIDELALKYPIVQKALPLILSSARINEKLLADELSIKQPEYALINNQEQLDKLTLAYPYLLKANTMGYDGKGQITINSSNDKNNVSFENNIAYLAESKIDFDYEISVIGVHSINGELKLYPPFYNIHHQGILNITLLSKEIPSKIIKQANEAVEKIMLKYNIYGLLCCEFFVKDDNVYFNEMAARPHNSGHITMDTHYCSQYENHLRALLGMKLGSTSLKCSGFMVNVLGQDVELLTDRITNMSENIKYYDYHKEARYNRKVAHLVGFNLSDIEFFENNWR